MFISTAKTEVMSFLGGIQLCKTMFSGIDGRGLWLNFFCATLRRHICATSSGAVHLTVG